MITLTQALIEKGSSSNKGYNADQLKYLGIKWPPRHGWKKRLIGKQIDDNNYKAFLMLKGIRKKKRNVLLSNVERFGNEENYDSFIRFTRIDK